MLGGRPPEDLGEAHKQVRLDPLAAPLDVGDRGPREPHRLGELVLLDADPLPGLADPLPEGPVEVSLAVQHSRESSARRLHVKSANGLPS